MFFVNIKDYVLSKNRYPKSNKSLFMFGTPLCYTIEKIVNRIIRHYNHQSKSPARFNKASTLGSFPLNLL